MWSIFGALSLLSFIVSPVGQRVIGSALTVQQETSMIETSVAVVDGSR